MAAETITFYSYKGGTGRSLVVSHVANYLSSFGKRVVAIDFDLEAPGLHFKLGLNNRNSPVAPERGLLDLMFDCLKRAAPLPASLQEFAPVVVNNDDSRGWIRLLAAGNTESSEYWGRLAQINWHDTFYAPDGLGVPFFLELVGRVETELEPDYILIDSRTGVTEIGGVATAILPDRLVCLFTNSLESLQGTRNVIRSVAVAPRLPSRSRVEILPILTRIPELDKDTETSITESALAYLNEPAERPEATLRFDEIFILHSEPSLQVREKLLTAGEDAEPPLLRDYLRLFSRLVPPEVVEPHIERLIENALRRIIDDPDGVQKDLETLARFYPHRASLRALLKFYRLRQAAPQLILRTAARLFTLTREARDEYLQETVKNYVKVGKLDSKEVDVVELVDAVWSETGESGLGFALYSAYGNKARAREIFRTLLDSPNLSATQVRTLFEQAMRNQITDDVLDQALGVARLHANTPEILVALVDLLAESRSPAELKHFIVQSGINIDAISRIDPNLAVKIAAKMDDAISRDAAAWDAMRLHVQVRDWSAVEELGRIYTKVGELRKFEEIIRHHLPDNVAEDILHYLKP